MDGGPRENDDGRTELQRRILEAARLYPEDSSRELADRCDCSASYVRRTLREHSDDERAFAIEVDGPIGLSDRGDGVVVERPDRTPGNDDGLDRSLFEPGDGGESMVDDPAREAADAERP